MGSNDIKAAARRVLEEIFPADDEAALAEVIAEDDIVVIHCTHSGRHTGDFFDAEPTGRTFAYKQMHMIRMADRKGVEHWAVRDDATLMRQLRGEQAAPAVERST